MSALCHHLASLFTVAAPAHRFSRDRESRAPSPAGFTSPRAMPRLPVCFSRPWFRLPLAGLIFFSATAAVPRWWCGRDSQRWFADDPDLVIPHAREVAAIVENGVSVDDFTSSSELFRSEWLFGSYQMAALGLLQTCAQHPAHRTEFLPVAERAIDELLSERVRAFDARTWKEDPLESLETSDRGHAAYLGYLNLALGLHRSLVPDSRFASLNDRISASLARRLALGRHGVLETYPRETYPVDNAAVLGSLLHMHVPPGQTMARSRGRCWSAFDPIGATPPAGFSISPSIRMTEVPWIRDARAAPRSPLFFSATGKRRSPATFIAALKRAAPVPCWVLATCPNIRGGPRAGRATSIPAR